MSLENRSSTAAKFAEITPLVPRRILLGAFVCAPGLGSEEGVGWGIAFNLAQFHRVHVLTTPRHRSTIETFLRHTLCTNLTFSYHDFPSWLLATVVTSAFWQIYYHAWQLRIGGWARTVAADFKPDLVHHVTYGRYWTPTTLWKLGRPFVWGPLGGGDKLPRAFLSVVPWRGRVGGKIRGCAQWLAEHDFFLRQTARRCDLALASTDATAARLRFLGCRRTEILIQNAVDEKLITAKSVQPDVPRLFCTVGRLLGWKAQVLSIKAFARAAIPNSQLAVIGDGPLKPWLVRTAEQLGVKDRVIFTGALSREATLAYMQRSVALVHSSLHDQAPTVVFEAMACGTPVIAYALGGLPVQIQPDTGCLIAAITIDQAVDEMAQAMKRVCADPIWRNELAENAREHLRDNFTWQQKAVTFSHLYEELLRDLPSSKPIAPELSPRRASDEFRTPLAKRSDAVLQ